MKLVRLLFDIYCLRSIKWLRLGGVRKLCWGSKYPISFVGYPASRPIRNRFLVFLCRTKCFHVVNCNCIPNLNIILYPSWRYLLLFIVFKAYLALQMVCFHKHKHVSKSVGLWEFLKLLGNCFTSYKSQNLRQKQNLQVLLQLRLRW